MTGTCSVCGDVSNTILHNLGGHKYGDWIITAPTKEAAGKAEKLCAKDNNHTHDIVVVLPALPESGNGAYASVVQSTENLSKFTYTFESEHGNIVFDAYHELTSVAAAVEVAVTTNRKAVEGTVTYSQTADLEGYFTSTTVSPFEYGNSYLHYDDKKNDKEAWYSYHNGNLFALTTKMYTHYELDANGVPLKQWDEERLIRDESVFAPDVEGDIFDGMPMCFWLAGNGHSEFGVANYIAYFYNIAKNNANGDLEESVDGNTYSFSFGLYDGGDNKYFHIISVSFSLNDQRVIENATLDCKTYVDKILKYDDDNNPIMENPTYEHIGNGQYRVIAGKAGSWKNHEVYTVNQSTTWSSGKAPENPYKYEDMVIRSLKIKDGNAEVGNSLTLNVGVAKKLTVDNLFPETCNLYIDPIQLYLRHEVDGKTVETPLAAFYDDGDVGHVKAFFDFDSKTITIQPYLAGELTFIIRTIETEKVITLNVPFKAPGSFGAQVYEVVEQNDTAEWNVFDKEFTIYTGQPLAFDSFVEYPEYENASFTVKVTGANATVTDGKVNGKPVKIFTASVAGEYTVKLSSTNGQTASFTVTVETAPTVAEILNGKYTLEELGIEVEFSPAENGATSGTAKITVSKGSITGSTVVDYYYDTSDGGRVITTHKSGISYFGFRFYISERYNVFISYTDEFGASQYRCLLKDGTVINPIPGTYVLTNLSEAEELTITVSGYYTIAYDPTVKNGKYLPYTRFYELNSVVHSSQFEEIPLTIDLKLNAGDTLKIYAVAEEFTAKTYTYVITYNGPAVDVTGVTLNKTELSLKAGLESETLIASVNPADASDKHVVWESSDETVATVNANGLVTALKAGTAIITVTTLDGGFTASCTVTVDIVHVEGITLSETEAELTVGGSALTLSCTFNPEYPSDKSVTWSTSDSGVVTVNTNGRVTAVGVGTATVTATSVSDPTVSATCTVTVNTIPVTGISVYFEDDPTVPPITEKAEHTVDIGSVNVRFTLKAKIAPETASDKSVTWTSSDTTVAIVVNGSVTVFKPGTATITATTADGGYTVQVVVIANEIVAESLTLNRTACDDLAVDGTLKLTATIAPVNVYNSTVTWTTSNSAIATVTDNGVVTGVAAGSVTITATTSNGVTATCAVTVLGGIEVESITLNKTSVTLGKGGYDTLTATVLPENAPDKSVTWTSSASSIVSVTSSGYITAKAIGTATITVTSVSNPEVSATCTVTVEAVLVSSVSFDNPNMTVRLYDTWGFVSVGTDLNIYPSNAENKTYTLALSDPSIVDITSDGASLTITAKKAGTTTVTVTMNDGSGKTAVCEITVVDNTLKEGDNEIPSTTLGVWDSYMFFYLANLPAGTYKIEGLDNGTLIEGLEFYNCSKNANLPLGNSIEVVLTDNELVELKILNPNKSDNVVAPFTITVTLIAEGGVGSEISPTPEYEVIEAPAAIEISLGYGETKEYSLKVEAGKTYVFTVDCNNEALQIMAGLTEVLNYDSTGEYTADADGYITISIIKLYYGTTFGTVSVTVK